MRTTLRALAYFREDLGAILLSLLAIGGMTVCGLLQVYPLAILTDNVFGPFKPVGLINRAFFALCPASPVRQTLLLAAVVLLLRVVQEVLQMAQTLLNIRVGYAGLLRVRSDLFAKLQTLGLDFHRARPQGDLIYRLMWDTCGVQTLLNVVFQTLLVSGITLAVMLGIMLSLNWRLTLVSLAVAPLLLMLTRAYNRVLTERATEAKVAESNLTTAAQRSVSTVALVQAFNRQADEFDRFSNVARLSVAAYLRLHRQEMIFWLMIGLTFGVGGAAVFGYGGYLIAHDQIVLHRGGAGMTIGKLTIFLAYLSMLYNPLRSLSGSGAQLASGVAGMNRVFDLLNEQPSVCDAANAVALPCGPHVLALRQVCFEYNPSTPVLNSLTATIPPGAMVAFVGASGVGKTTLLNLLPRFYDPTGGAVTLGGHDLRELKLRDVRNHIAMVVQGSILLPASVRENIAFGRPGATDEQIHHAAELAGVAAFVETLPRRWDEIVTEDGQNLSGGQKQRIAIARALLTEAPIVVLDEPTSALDAHQEANLVQTLHALRGTRTIILVSHRLSTVADCDTIYLVHDGKVAEQGAHEQLLELRGRYFELAKHQMRLEPDSAPA